MVVEGIPAPPVEVVDIEIENADIFKMSLRVVPSRASDSRQLMCCFVDSSFDSTGENIIQTEKYCFNNCYFLTYLNQNTSWSRKLQ